MHANAMHGHGVVRRRAASRHVDVASWQPLLPSSIPSTTTLYEIRADIYPVRSLASSIARNLIMARMCILLYRTDLFL